MNVEQIIDILERNKELLVDKEIIAVMEREETFGAEDGKKTISIKFLTENENSKAFYYWHYE